MKLLNSLFQIVESSETSTGFLATIQLFPDHIIFKGHFPGYPVTPGVIFLQVVHELIENHLKKTIHLVEMSNCKFLKIVNPENENVAVISVDLLLAKQFFYVKAMGKNDSGAFFKLGAKFAGGVANHYY